MKEELVLFMRPHTDGVYVDASFGAGGWSAALLEGGAGRVLALDRDAEAARRGAGGASGGRLKVLEGRFSRLGDILEEEGLEEVDGVAFDAGLSSDQLESDRGFSFRREGRLDMRMGGEGRTAEDWLHELDEEGLARILRVYGGERRAGRLSRAIMRARERGGLRCALDLARAASEAVEGGARRAFQALRILVNDEVGELVRGLSATQRVLRAGGRVVTATFHSLEDGVVKRFFKEASTFRALTKKPRRPSEEEVERNPRAKSARMRCGERVEGDLWEGAAGWAPDVEMMTGVVR